MENFRLPCASAIPDHIRLFFAYTVSCDTRDQAGQLERPAL
jgi:hypothetical protein